MLDNKSRCSYGLFSYFIKHKTSTFDRAYYERQVNICFSSSDEAYLHWLNIGRSKGVSYCHGQDTILKIVLKIKNDKDLLPKWIEHHSSIVGFENLIILDCGSDDEDYLNLLSEVSKYVLVIKYSKYYDHIHSTNSNFDFFNLLSKNCKYLTILDADEFLVSLKDGILSSDGVKEFLKHSEEPVHCGAWLFNAKFLPTKYGKLSWEDAIEFSLKANDLISGVNSGKAIVKSDWIFKVKHLGHNLHVRDVVERCTEKSLGNIFVLHLQNLNPSVNRARIARHLKAKMLFH